MPLILLRYWPHIAAVVIVMGGTFYIHQRAYNRGQADIQQKWDAHSLRQNQVISRQQTENAKLQNDYDLLRFQHNDAIKEKVAAVRRGDDLARRLREHFQSSSPGPLSPPAVTAPGTAEPVEGAGGEGGTDDALKRYDTEAQICGVNEEGWLLWWDEVKRLQQPPGALWKEAAPFP
jgi:hypothetical protein